MKPRSNAFRSRQMRGLGVAGAIAGAAAAVAASVVIAERPQNDRLLPPSASAELVSPGGASRSEPRVRTRSPKDAGRLIPGPWVQRSGIAEWADNAGAGVTMPTDVSVPNAAAALKDVDGAATETPPTF